MNIDRHNYEECFILYMDNELSPQERRQVEEFVEKHPDLKEELDILSQYRFAPDKSIVFKDKEELMMAEASSPVNADNYQEWMLLYIDNELSNEHMAAFESFAANNAVVGRELSLLKKTKLEPESIVFANKQVLLRTEKVRIMSGRWWKIAAAAALVLAISAAAIITMNRKSPGIDIANHPSDLHVPAKQNPVAQTGGEIKEQKSTVVVNSTGPAEHFVVKGAGRKIVREETVIAKHKSPAKEEGKQPQVIAGNDQKPTNNLPQPLNNPNVVINERANEVVKSDVANPQEQKPVNRADVVTTQPIATSYNQSAENITQPESKKGRLRGFLRKATRIFEKTTNINPADDENRVLIGGLALKLN